nr:hypothetical protein [Ramlibacter agri]
MNIGGVKVYPTAVKEVVESLAPAISGQMQILLDAPPPRVVPPLKIAVEAAANVVEGDWAGLQEKIEQRLHAALKIRAKVTLVAAGSLATSNLKTRLVHVVPAGKPVPAQP